MSDKTLKELLLILLFTKDKILAELGSIPIYISIICYFCALLMMTIYYTIFHPSKFIPPVLYEPSSNPDQTIEIIETYQPLPRFKHLEKWKKLKNLTCGRIRSLKDLFHANLPMQLISLQTFHAFLHSRTDK